MIKIFRTLLLWIICCHFNNFPLQNGQTGCNPSGVSVNTKHKYGNYALTFNFYGFVATYTANKGYVITSVTHGNHLIWRSVNESDPAFHVRVEGIGTKNKSVTIFHSTGEKTKFSRVYRCCGLLRKWRREVFNPIYTVDDRVPLGQSRDAEDDADEYKDGELGYDSDVSV
ncbi:hypothetical protein MACK_003685 [Theileria orientalis]|uniref:Uncharacterized protein n=1 Tax=Theileria orientalis TaxID=68886 RepID=A0A976SJM3_THEOR|nr:hypothetical protein MACK_003685 [Theileria orientalis]